MGIVRRASSSLPQLQVMIRLGALIVCALASVSSAGYYHPGYRGYHHPLVKCEKVVEAVTKKLCRIEVEKECVTKTKTFKKFVEYKDSEVCKHELPLPYHGPFHHKREAEP